VLKELNTKAASEITIRQALSELDMWEFETYFSTLKYIDSKGQNIQIIGDFKTIFNSVRCIIVNLINHANDIKNINFNNNSTYFSLH
jgi:dynein heavy chain 2